MYGTVPFVLCPEDTAITTGDFGVAFQRGVVLGIAFQKGITARALLQEDFGASLSMWPQNMIQRCSSAGRPTVRIKFCDVL